MSGIIFFRTKALRAITDFYVNEVGMGVWLDQGGCVIMKHGNMLLGFCEGDNAETEGCITFYYESEEEVDVFYERLKDIATTVPAINERYRIYNFFAKDPEGRTIEFQKFLNPIEPVP